MAVFICGVDYRKLTVREVISGINQHQRQKENEVKANWEQTRQIMYTVIDTSMAKQADKEKAKRSIKFPWDKEQGLTEDRIKELKNISDRLHGKSF